LPLGGAARARGLRVFCHELFNPERGNDQRHVDVSRKVASRPVPTGALTITCVVSCESPERLRLAEELARKTVALGNVFTDVARAFPDGVEVRITREHKLGDYFEEIQVLSDYAQDPTSFRLVFRPRKDANRYWRDLLVNILQSIHDSVEGVLIKSVTQQS